MYDVKVYRKPDGCSPVEEYIENLPNKLKSKTIRNIDLLREVGSNAKRPLSAYVKDGIFELRTRVGTNLTRILYFFVVGKTIVLTNGFTKKSDELPDSEIELAKKYKTDYERRESNG